MSVNRTTLRGLASAGPSAYLRNAGPPLHFMRGPMIRSTLAATLILISGSAFAQTPYSGMQARPIKALSEQQVADLGAGRGMGLALAAAFNGYPGPSPVPEMSRKIELF